MSGPRADRCRGCGAMLVVVREPQAGHASAHAERMVGACTCTAPTVALSLQEPALLTIRMQELHR